MPTVGNIVVIVCNCFVNALSLLYVIIFNPGILGVIFLPGTLWF